MGRIFLTLEEGQHLTRFPSKTGPDPGGVRQKSMVDPAPAPTPAPIPAPVPTPAPIPTPTPGWKTSEAWISFLVIVLGALPSSGLLNNEPALTKIVGLIVAALSGVNYTYQRSAIKRAALTASLARLPSGSTKTGGAL
jgi:hypothetical protein